MCMAFGTVVYCDVVARTLREGNSYSLHEVQQYNIYIFLAPPRRRNIYEFSILNCGMTVRSTRGVGKKKRHTNLTELEINTLENEVSNLTKDAEFPCNTINIYSLEFI